MSSGQRVSVIVTAYNREAMVADAVSSVLAQTMRDFELIVVDDGSTDRTVEIVKGFGDPRVRLIEHGTNRGIPSARNSGLEAATGRYIAWLDSDDIARPRRLQVEADYLDANPSIAMIGARAGTIKASGRRSWLPRSRPSRHEEIVAMLLFRSALLQSTIMGRSEILKAYPYRLEFPVAQDLDQFIRVSRKHRVANLPQVLVDRRFHSGQVVKQRADLIVDRKRVLFRESLERLGIEPTGEELDRHIVLGRIKDFRVDRGFLEWSRAWLRRILEANRAAQIYDRGGLDGAVGRIWRHACLASLRGPDRFYGLMQLARRPRV